MRDRYVLLRWVRKLAVAGAAHGLLLIAVLTSYQAIARKYIPEAPLGWVPQITTYTLAWMTFFFIAVGFWRGVHIRLSFIADFLIVRGSRIRGRALAGLAWLVFMGVGVLWLVLGLSTSLRQIEAGILTVGGLEVSSGLVRLCVPMGGAAIIAVGLRLAAGEALARIRRRRRTASRNDAGEPYGGST